MTLIELNNIAKEGDRASLISDGNTIIIDFPIQDDGCLYYIEDVLSDQWQLIPRAKECFVNVYEDTIHDELIVGCDKDTLDDCKEETRLHNELRRGTLHITYDGKLKVEVVE